MNIYHVKNIYKNFLVLVYVLNYYFRIYKHFYDTHTLILYSDNRSFG